MANLHRNVYINTTTNPTLNGLIGDRCYPIRLPNRATLPAVTYAKISDDDAEFRAHGEATERTVSRVTFNVWADTPDEATTVAEALVAAWSGYRLPPDIGWAQLALYIEAYEESLNRFRSTVDVRIEHAR